MLIQLFAQYGLAALFGLIFFERVGLPLPSEIALLVAAAGAGRGLFPIGLVVLAAACVVLGVVILLARRRPRWAAVRAWVSAHPRVLGALAVSLLAMTVFAQLADSVVERETLAQLDLRLADAIHAAVSATLLAVTLRFTDLGAIGVAALGLVVAGVLAWRRRLWDLAFWVLALGGGEGLNLLLKAVFQRPRPVFAAAVGETDWSFPSGHAMASLVAYGALAVLLAAQFPRAKIPLYLGCGFLIALIGASRLVLGVHYLTDVLAGFAAGLAWLALCLGLRHVRAADAEAPVLPTGEHDAHLAG